MPGAETERDGEIDQDDASIEIRQNRGPRKGGGGAPALVVVAFEAVILGDVMRPTMHVVKNDEVSAESARFSRTLDRLAVDRRGAVACLLANTPEYLFAYRGATWSGRRFTPMSGRWSADEVDYVVENCEADCLVVDARFSDRVARAAERVPPSCRFAVGGEIPGFRSWSEVAVESGAPYEAPLAGSTMLYTSGTTGRPKGVWRRPDADSPRLKRRR